MRRLVLAVSLLPLSGCSGILPPPQTVGEFFSGYNYVPLDPLPVKVVDGPNCGPERPRGPLLSELPDNAVRIAVRKLTGSASGGFGPAQIGYQGNSYQVILDYINADVANIRFLYTGGNALESGATFAVQRVDNDMIPAVAGPGQGEIVIPVYVGVGLRLTANVTVHKGSVNLSSLGSLSAAAEAERVTGSLIVQTLGITGSKVTTALPLPNELNSTTIQNAIVALGAVKALVPEQGTLLRPRVTGIYNPIPNSDQRTIHLIVSQLASTPVEWAQDCPVK